MKGSYLVDEKVTDFFTIYLVGLNLCIEIDKILAEYMFFFF